MAPKKDVFSTFLVRLCNFLANSVVTLNVLVPNLLRFPHGSK